MSKILFHEDAYLKEHQTKVKKIEGNRILLEETIFFPQTSTESGDVGKINDCKVVGLKKEGDEIWHILNKTPVFKEGDTVALQLDWNTRYKMMRLHSALHLWAGVFDCQFKERAVAGVVKSNSAYLVFKHELANEIIQKALEQANKDIREELEIKTYEDEKKKGFRWCQVGNYIPIPCGGLHVKNTKEIGELTLREKIIEAGKQKLTMEVK
ncbi:MAG: alanyl-tRNA editing protein [Nanoarchaeota archaeon]|nr:alanyl-tRNA editing protein [Nanoarchaeota archaeon]